MAKIPKPPGSNSPTIYEDNTYNAVRTCAERNETKETPAEQTFVYENIEVIKTGRTADRTVKSGKVYTLVEITPVDKSIGGWKKWVNETDLFKIESEK